MSATLSQENGALESLFEILKSEESLSNELLDLLDQEQTALTAVDLKGLVNLSQKKNNLASRIHNLDETLQHLARKLLRQQDNGLVRLSALEERLSRETAVRMKGCRERLQTLRQRIQDCNLINKKFAEDTLGYINDGIAMISGAAVEPGLYQNRGRSRKTGYQSALISREV